MQPLVTLSRAFDVEIVSFLLTLPRLYAYLSATQLLNNSVIPGMPRTVAVLSLAFVATPINMAYAEGFAFAPALLMGYIAKEIAIGYLIGYLVGWVFWVVQAAGGLIDNQRGAAIASSIDPLVGEEATALGNLFSQSFLTFVFASGAFLPVLGVLYDSYVLWPATKAAPIISDQFPKMLLAMFDHSMGLAVTLAAPIIAIMFAAEFSLAMISRFAPQIQVFVLAMPIKSLLAIIVLLFYMRTMMPFATEQLVQFRYYSGNLYEMLNFGEKMLNRRAPAGESGRSAP